MALQASSRTLGRCWLLGEDRPYTLATANNLADSLRAVGEDQAARELDADTLARGQRGKVGPDQ